MVNADRARIGEPSKQSTIETKFEITEHQTITVPVSHEVARLEREPIDDHDREKMSSVVELKEEEIEIVLHAERPVVSARPE